MNKNFRERFITKPGKFLKLPGRERLFFLEALLLHLWIGLLIRIIPFRWIPRFFSSRQFETPTMEEDQSRTRSVATAVSSQQSGIVENIRDAVQRAGRVSPWRNRCLVSSLAGRCMLRTRKIDSQLSLGITKNTDGRPVAHAWLKSGDYELVDKNGDYTTLYTF